MSLKLVTMADIPINAPLAHEAKDFGGADEKMVLSRRGFVELRVCVQFPGEMILPVSFTKKFEVLEHAEDFIFGNETFETLFPNNPITKYGAKQASITDSPRDVVRHVESAPLLRRMFAADSSKNEEVTDPSEAQLSDMLVVDEIDFDSVNDAERPVTRASTTAAASVENDNSGSIDNNIECSVSIDVIIDTDSIEHHQHFVTLRSRDRDNKR